MINEFNTFKSFKSFIEPILKENSKNSNSQTLLYYYVHEQNNIDKRFNLLSQNPVSDSRYTVKILAITSSGTFYFRNSYPGNSKVLLNIKTFIKSYISKEFKIIRKKESNTILIRDYKPKDRRYYLAYGSNLCIEQMKKRCPNAVAIGTGYINDYVLAFRRTGKPCLTIDKRSGSKVPVAVWEITPSDEDELDYFEGYPNSYKKLETKVKILETGKVVKGFMYIMKENQEYARPLHDYWTRCVTGYDDFGLNLKYLKDALDYSTKHLGEY